jgi:uncharacterized protein YndB with AHSA1/START domain
MWGKFVYREIIPPRLLVLVSSFSDAAGGKARHPFAANWPVETLSTTTLAEHEGKTTITIRWRPLSATAVEQATFDQSHDGMRMGWKGTFEQLEEFLSRS